MWFFMYCFMYLAPRNKLSCLSGACHLVRKYRMGTVLEGSSGDVAREGSTTPLQISCTCWTFLSFSLSMNVAYPPLLSKAGTVPAKKQKQKINHFSYCTLFPHRFFGEALHRGNNLFSLKGKYCSHHPLLHWPCNRMKKGLFSSSFSACPGGWPSTYFCIKPFSLKLKCSWSSI